ncbi:MAG: hypothetical protein Q7W16_08090 [Coriobacteriia bacterium]|nr:hypothetical protein [Coriobacteriia bacterium]
MGDTADSRVGAMLGLGAGWVVVCFFAVAPVSAAVAFLAGLLGRPGLVNVTAFAAVVEAIVYLVFALAVFRAARALDLPHVSWLLGPAGYLVAFGLYIAVMLLLGDTMAVPRGEGWAFVAADTLVTAAGAWAMTRRLAPGAMA